MPVYPKTHAQTVSVSLLESPDPISSSETQTPSFRQGHCVTVDSELVDAVIDVTTICVVVVGIDVDSAVEPVVEVGIPVVDKTTSQ